MNLAESLRGRRRLSNATKLSSIGLALAAAGMLLQIASGSQLYPSLAGPVFLLVAAGIVAFGRSRWTPLLALVAPLALGVGAVIAAALTGDFVDQLTNIGALGTFTGSVMHVAGLLVATAAGVAMLLERHPAG